MKCARSLSLTVLLLACPVRAADLWLITNSAIVLEEEKVWAALVQGDIFPISSGSTESLTGFVDHGPEKTVNLDGQLELDGTFSIRRSLRGPGIHVLGAELTSPGADGPLIQSAKTIVQVEPADPNDLAYASPIGHSLEIIPSSNPCTWKSSQTIEIKVLLDGHPWPAVSVELRHEGEQAGDPTAKSITDENGSATFTQTKAGHGSITAHVQRVRNSIGKPLTESLAATLSFRVAGTSDVSRMLLAVRNIHGDLDPAAVLGYRMGKRALQEMKLAGGAASIEATVWAPPASPILGILDGVQAATSVSYGRENLKLERTPSPADAQAVFTDRSTNGRVVCALKRSEELVKSLVSVSDARERQMTAMWLATRDDSELFDVTLMPATADPLTRPPAITPAAIVNAD